MLEMCTDMQVGLHVKGWFLTTTEKCQQTSVNPMNIKFKENLCSESQFITSGETDMKPTGTFFSLQCEHALHINFPCHQASLNSFNTGCDHLLQARKENFPQWQSGWYSTIHSA